MLVDVLKFLGLLLLSIMGAGALMLVVLAAFLSTLAYRTNRDYPF